MKQSSNSNRKRILFVGELHSSHALSWIDLLTSRGHEYEIMGVHISWAPVPSTSFPIVDVVENLNIRETRLFIQKLFHRRRQYVDGYIHGRGEISAAWYERLARVIDEYKPHIVHTLGIFPAGVFYFHGYQNQVGHLENKPVWVVQARGGADIALNFKNPLLVDNIKQVLEHCDCFIADNEQNYVIARSLGLAVEKISPTGIVPGAGGIDFEQFKDINLPSKKERLIIWPKAYNCIQSDGLVVVEALRLSLPRLGQFRLVATAAMPDVEYWFREYLGSYGQNVEITDRLDRQELLNLIRDARVLLAPSLSDGVPNTMYEAMASHTVPILSPIDTLTTLFENNKNVIYASNLNPLEIADALVKAMSDDDLVDSIAIENKILVQSLADRDVIQDRVIKLYRNLSRKNSDGFVTEYSLD